MLKITFWNCCSCINSIFESNYINPVTVTIRMLKVKWAKVLHVYFCSGINLISCGKGACFTPSTNCKGFSIIISQWYDTSMWVFAHLCFITIILCSIGRGGGPLCLKEGTWIDLISIQVSVMWLLASRGYWSAEWVLGMWLDKDIALYSKPRSLVAAGQVLS